MTDTKQNAAKACRGFFRSVIFRGSVAAPLITICVTASDAAQLSDSKSSVRLETIIALSTGPESETPEEANARAVKFDAEIDRLLEVLVDAGGPVAREAPVRMSGLPVVSAAENVNDGYVHATAEQSVRSAHNAIVILEPDSSIGSVENCIVIVPGWASFGAVQNSIVLGRFDVAMWQSVVDFPTNGRRSSMSVDCS